MTESSTVVPYVMVAAAAQTGGDARLMAVEAMPATTAATRITGLPAGIARSTLDRLQAAITGSAECAWPTQPVHLNISPEPLPAGDDGLDLPIAVALLAASGQIPAERLAATLFIGALHPDGALHPVPEVARRLTAAAHAGLPTAVVAAGNLTDAILNTRSRVLAAHTLSELVAGLRGQAPLQRSQAWPTADLADLPGPHPHARRVLEVTAAGGHHLLLTGPPDNTAEILAERLPGLLPDLDPATAEQVTAVHRQVGTVPLDAPARHRPPWQALHPPISGPALMGTLHRPGAAALAHGGVLFCAGAEDLDRPARDALRSVLDQPRVTLLGAQGSVTYPARVQVLLAAQDCTLRTHRTDCSCAPAVHRWARNRMAVLLDRIHIHADLPAMAPSTGQPSGEPTAVVAARVAAARAVAARRWSHQPWTTNAEATAAALRIILSRAPASSFAALKNLINAGSLSLRGGLHVRRVALTIADLAEHDRPTAEDVAEAIRLHTGRQA